MPDGYHHRDLEGVRVEFSALSDAELVTLARGGSAPAFAVLLHRHGPAVRAVVANDEDPAGAVISTYVDAMRRLANEPHDPDQARPWLLDLAADHVKHPEAVGDEPLPHLEPEELDEIWAEVELRWPHGRVPRHVPAWLGWTALVVAVISLGVLVPYAAVAWGTDDPDDERTVLRAEPFEHEEFVREEAPELVEEEDLAFDLPPIDFGTPDDPPVITEPEPEPPPPPQPQPEFVEPDPEPEVEDPEETEEETEEPTDSEGDGDDEEENQDPPPEDEEAEDPGGENGGD